MNSTTTAALESMPILDTVHQLQHTKGCTADDEWWLIDWCHNSQAWQPSDIGHDGPKQNNVSTAKWKVRTHITKCRMAMLKGSEDC